MVAIIGPRNSGKSRIAEALFPRDERKVYLATLPYRREFESRIARHRFDRQSNNWMDAEYYAGIEPAEMLQGVLAAAPRDCRAVLIDGVAAMMARRMEFLAFDGSAIEPPRQAVVRAIADMQVCVDSRSKLVLVTGDDRSRDTMSGGVSVANVLQELMSQRRGYEEVCIRGVRILVNELTSAAELDALASLQTI